jgi:hypothetical protein
MGTAMWRYVLCCKAKDEDCNVTLCPVLEERGWAIRRINLSEEKRCD